MEALTETQLSSKESVLEGYGRFAVLERPYPEIRLAPEARTSGRVYVSVDPHTLSLLDRFEGAMYQRESALVTARSGEAMACEVYVVCKIWSTC